MLDASLVPNKYVGIVVCWPISIPLSVVPSSTLIFIAYLFPALPLQFRRWLTPVQVSDGSRVAYDNVGCPTPLSVIE